MAVVSQECWRVVEVAERYGYMCTPPVDLNRVLRLNCYMLVDNICIFLWVNHIMGNNLVDL